MRIDTAALVERSSDRLRWDDLDLDSFKSQPLDRLALRCIKYMHDVEFHTVCYLRDLLLTPAHSDARVTAFLNMWTYQEYWHGEALAAVLAAHGEAHGEERVRAVRPGRALATKPVLSSWHSAAGWVGATSRPCT
jgi:hypothetical protein